METKQEIPSLILVEEEPKWRTKDGEILISELPLADAKKILKLINKRIGDYGKLITLHKHLKHHVEQRILTYPVRINSVDEIRQSGKYYIESEGERLICEVENLESSIPEFIELLKTHKIYEMQE